MAAGVSLVGIESLVVTVAAALYSGAIGWGQGRPLHRVDDP